VPRMDMSSTWANSGPRMSVGVVSPSVLVSGPPFISGSIVIPCSIVDGFPLEDSRVFNGGSHETRDHPHTYPFSSWAEVPFGRETVAVRSCKVDRSRVSTRGL
jgi:hypothetical protein